MFLLSDLQGVLILHLMYIASCLPTWNSKSSKWTIRSNTAWSLFQQSPCNKFRFAEDCTVLKSRTRSQMNLYTAESISSTSTMNARFVESALGEFKNFNALVVFDPYPDAHFGHTVLVFLIRYGYKRKQCAKRKGVLYQLANGSYECMYVADTTPCLHRVRHSKKGRKRCEISYLPLVYDTSSIQLTQRLSCRSDIAGYHPCPEIVTSTNLRCMNSGRCSHQNLNRGRGWGRFSWFNNLCVTSCDYAILISGGWNSFMNQPRHYENMKDMWKYLTDKGFREDNMRAYFANNGTIDLDANKTTDDTLPATESSGILQHLASVCNKPRRCIDNLVLYLNGPATVNGNMLLWDRNADGLASVSETLRMKSILAALEKCNARGYVVIADQNYAGHLVERVREGRSKGLKNYDRISVVASSDKSSYTWERQFTEKMVQLDNVWIDSNRSMAATRKLDRIAQDLKKTLSDFKIQYLPSEVPNQTITGDYAQQPGCNVNIPVTDTWNDPPDWRTGNRNVKEQIKFAGT